MARLLSVASIPASGQSPIDEPGSHVAGSNAPSSPTPGTVKVVQDVPRIEIDDAKQIRIVEAKDKK